MSEQLVSIITPCYNAEKFILETYKSIKKQTYRNWEWIIVDDKSTDNSCQIIKEINDSKIVLYEPDEKLGPANARNLAVLKSNGRYIAYLDADDFWHPRKLEKQIEFMKTYRCGFSFTGYEFANCEGKLTGKKVVVPHTMRYKDSLKNTIIWTSTVVIDTTYICSKDIMMPDIKSEDTALWWNLLMKYSSAYGLNEVLAFYRRSSNTLSSNKIEAIRRIWYLYRKHENLSIIKSLYLFTFYLFNTIKKRI